MCIIFRSVDVGERIGKFLLFIARELKGEEGNTECVG